MLVYDGPSVLNGDPIVGIITGLQTPSSNPKTGTMAQLWILHQDEAPHLAVKSGKDASVCGDCPARNKWCYVQTFQGPRSVWAAWKRGSYPPYDPLLLQGKALRLGAYGDPAALPLSTLERITKDVDMYTGYTHAWKYCDARYKRFCMASCDSVADAEAAIKSGWRSFRVSTEAHDRALTGEITCPASSEADNLLTCITCRTCDGNRRGLRSSVVIQAHGNRTKRFIEYGKDQQAAPPDVSKETVGQQPR